MGFPCCIIKGNAMLGCLVHRKTCTTFAFTQINLEDKGALAQLVKAIWTNDNDKYDEICYHWVGNVLGPKSVAHIAKPKKAKAKEIKWAQLPISEIREVTLLQVLQIVKE